MQGIQYWQNRPRNDTERDWFYGKNDWISDYIESVVHPHREVIIEALKKIDFESILEIGCACAPNLMLINVKFPNKKLSGIDANADAITEGLACVKNADLRVGDLRKLPYSAQSFDVILADASLMYVGPYEIRETLGKMDHVAKKAIVIVDRFDESLEGEARYTIWQRNYPKLLEELGYKVESIKLTEETWPNSEGWKQYGYCWIATK